MICRFSPDDGPQPGGKSQIADTTFRLNLGVGIANPLLLSSPIAFPFDSVSFASIEKISVRKLLL